MESKMYARVIVTLESSLSEDELAALVQRAPVWAVRTSRNREAAEHLWPGGRGLGATALCFFNLDGDDVLQMLPHIDEHMEDVGWDRYINELELRGVPLTPELDTGLKRADFKVVVNAPDNIVARRGPISRPTTEEFDATRPKS
jgi:hypothetical protein